MKIVTPLCRTATLVAFAFSASALSVLAGNTKLNIDTSKELPHFSVSYNANSSSGSYNNIGVGYFIAGYSSGALLPQYHDNVKPGVTPGKGQFYTFCLDIGYSLSDTRNYKSTTFPALNTGNGNPVWLVNGIYKAAYLYNKFIGQLVPASNVAQFGTTPQRIIGAALQLAIWNVLYDTDNTVLSGTGFKASAFGADADAASAIALADTMLNDNNLKGAWNPALNRTTTYWDTVNPANLNDPSVYNRGQALIGPPVPEPAEMALAVCALGGLVFGYRRLRQQDSASAVMPA